MKINGVPIRGRNQVVVAIPRPTGPLIFIAEAVASMAPIDKLLPMPKPPGRQTPHKGIVYDTNDKGYKKAIERREELRSIWLFLETFKTSPGLEWETVDINNPATYHGLDKELANSDINWIEYQRLISAMNEANCLNEEIVEAARMSFLLGTLGQAELSSGQNTEQESSPSGEPADE